MSAAADGEFQRRAHLAGLRVVSLAPTLGGTDPVDPEAARLLSAATARALRAIPMSADRRRAVVAFAGPGDRSAIESVEALLRRRIEAVAAAPEEIARAQERVFGPEPEALVPPVAAPAVRRDARRLARQARLPFVSLAPRLDWRGRRRDPVNVIAAQSLAEDVCRRFGVVAVSATKTELAVAVADPGDEVALRVVHSLALRPVRIVVAPAGEIAAAIDRVFAPPSAQTAVPGIRTRARPRMRLRLGELLVSHGRLAPYQLAAALVLNERIGVRLGQVLLHEGMVDEETLVAALAEQLRLPDVDLSGIEPDPAALAVVPEPLARQHRLVPLAIVDDVLYLAMSDPLDDAAVAELQQHTKLRIRTVVAAKTQVEALLQRLYASLYVRVATAELYNRSPDESAYRILTFAQKLVFSAAAAITIGLLVWNPITTIIAFNVGSLVFYTSFSLYKFKLVYNALSHDLELPVSAAEVAALTDRELPVYTVLVPLYREAAVLPRLVASIAALDYPREKLDVKLIVEEDDEETRGVLRAQPPPPHFKVVVVPNGQPKTKPKACNYGLIQAEGSIAVIYDAEDRPEPDQLKKIVVAFSKAEPRIVCIQCKLNYYNRNQNLLTRWFAAEYSSWFDLLMPGLDAADAPIPLGGTSNHFRREKLVEIGAWDPFNVTEDADLGVRLFKAGYKTAIVDSTTFEEANSQLGNWLRQRSRWVKGYIQTWLVHMRHPLRLRRQMGWRGWLSFQLIVGGTFWGFLLNPFYWTLTTLWLLTEAHFIQDLFPHYVFYAAAAGLFLGNFAFTYLNVAGVVRRDYHDLVRSALFSPIYWALMSLGAWKGFLQLFYRPYYWEKTVHGLDRPEEDGRPSVAPPLEKAA